MAAQQNDGIIHTTHHACCIMACSAQWKETYADFPDEGVGFLGKEWHGKKQGDSRSCMSPFLAHR